jgi:hypothetical protein
MIISASRRTDIPAYYSEWFFNRLQEGFCYTTNPMNPRQFHKISLEKDIVDAIVFWSKNPYPMLKKLHLLEGYHYYFQYTITPYSHDIERNLPLKKYLIDTFIRLSDEIGKNRVIWRYDPILFSPKYTLSYHLEQFALLCEQIAPYTTKAVISFITLYRKVRKQCSLLHITCPQAEEKNILLQAFAKICFEHGIKLEVCAQEFPQGSKYPIFPAHCIDIALINALAKKNLMIPKDPYQREHCGCVKSYDIGMYNSCHNNCLYCYASYQQERLEENKILHHPDKPILLGEIPKDAQIIEKNITTYNNDQCLLF